MPKQKIKTLGGGAGPGEENGMTRNRRICTRPKTLIRISLGRNFTGIIESKQVLCDFAMVRIRLHKFADYARKNS